MIGPLKDLLGIALPGTLRVLRGKGFMLGDITTAQLAEIPCGAQREGEERRVLGSSGTASREVRCEYDGSAWAWEEVGVAALGTTLGLGTIAAQDADDVLISGGAITGITDLALADGGTGASDAATARANLGVGLDFISSGSFTTASSASVNDVFTSTYENYLVLVNITAASGTTVGVHMRLRVSGSDDSTASAYRRAGQAWTSAPAAGAVGDANTYWELSFLDGAAIGQNGLSIQLFRPAIADETGIVSTASRISAGSHGGLMIVGGAHNNNTAYDGFSIFPSSGTITGTWRVYGYRNS